MLVYVKALLNVLLQNFVHVFLLCLTEGILLFFEFVATLLGSMMTCYSSYRCLKGKSNKNELNLYE